ncbi:ABC transporter substrate-binding protein [Planctomyces sp. SH-PL14]|uniref:ABC transporter substrate-binding protein n=1 Tax=Planctomyces sp. SH-PL14 TaxID=1632864 RepID=UPI00078E1464|nr:ABC transporter substrate-binding protein [Planctomyces sp. SH-PL14]AMV18529.1 Bicarbonate transport ATP-binding protein CmpC [Planctomyces sp. SH-PL14]
MTAPTTSFPHRRLLGLGLSCLLATILGCQEAAGPGTKPAAQAPAGPAKVKIGYLGLTCEAAMFVAAEKGFFKEEGIEVEFVKTDWDGLRDGLGLGRFDANYTLIMYLLKPIEQGLDVKITGGVHSGCLRVQADPKSSVKTVADLKGKTIGIPTMGSPPFLFASRALKAAGMDPRSDVTWKVVSPEVMGLALDNGDIDAVADSEPLGSILAATKNVHTIADQALDAPYRDEYCCATVVSGKFLARDPASAAKVTRALLKGALWVDTNPGAAGELSVASKYVASTAEINGHAIGKLTFMPGVTKCRDSILSAAREMKTAGLLNSSTDPDELARRAWTDLDGVTDEWLKGVQVEKVAGGGAPPALDPVALARLFATDTNFRFMCCDQCVSRTELCGQ